ncbi:alkaline phosphatase family protein [Halosquirtibacter xylanolyticus]|uniref:alkaline phosphatase family protein n=1 Tax=Halosquirtibacter xylanolyticus TaxID=3374599 RepID=UPI0037491C18|nr:alkaline phosphatase family protein [Prolixibacteraceae bacterium]
MKHSIKLLLPLLLLVVNIPSFAQNNSSKVVVNIFIENMRNDYIIRYWPHLREDGFKRFYRQGYICSNVQMSQSVMDRSSSITTLTTGSWPQVHGIVSNHWYHWLNNEKVEAVDDPYYITVGSDSDEGKASAHHLLVPTMGDQIKQISLKRSKTYTISLNRNTAILASGHISDGAYWLDNTSGNFISSSYYLETFPEWAFLFNKKRLIDDYITRKWEPLLPESEYSESLADDYILEKGYAQRYNSFPHDLEDLHKKSGSYKILKSTPYGNQLVSDFAKNLIESEELGKDQSVYQLNIVFSTMDSEGINFGPTSMEMEDTFLRLDTNIASMLSFLDQKYGKGNYLVSIANFNPTQYGVEYLNEELKMPVKYFDPTAATALLKSYLNIRFEKGNWILLSENQQIFFDRDLIRKRKLSLTEFQNETATFLKDFEAISQAWSASTLLQTDFTSQNNLPFSHGFNAKRSGDVVFKLRPNWAVKDRYSTPSYYGDKQLMFMFLGNGIRHYNDPKLYNATDLTPSISYLISIPSPSGSSGQAITNIKK